jgi:hypothetical protein
MITTQSWKHVYTYSTCYFTPLFSPWGFLHDVADTSASRPPRLDHKGRTYDSDGSNLPALGL